MNDAAIDRNVAARHSDGNKDVIDPFRLQRIEIARRQIAAEKSPGVREVVDAAHHEAEKAKNHRIP